MAELGIEPGPPAPNATQPLAKSDGLYRQLLVGLLNDVPYSGGGSPQAKKIIKISANPEPECLCSSNCVHIFL